MKTVEGKIRKADEIYRMIDDGDRIAVGVSGGKDSVALLCGLASYGSYAKKRFSLTALVLDPGFFNKPGDYSKVEELCEKLNLPMRLRRSDIGRVVFGTRGEKNPCSLCARMRRGALHNMAIESGCNKIAFGHHMDDAVETFFLNMFYEGRIAAFQPVTYLSRKNITLIRPLILCTESEVRSAVKRGNLPIVKSRCPVDGQSKRQEMKEFIGQKESEYPGFLKKTFAAMQKGDISGLSPKNNKESL